MSEKPAISEADILERIVRPELGELSATTASELLKLRFDSQATRRVRTLLRANNRGTLDAEERAELERYLRVGQLLDLLHAKARRSVAAQVSA